MIRGGNDNILPFILSFYRTSLPPRWIPTTYFFYFTRADARPAPTTSFLCSLCALWLIYNHCAGAHLLGLLSVVRGLWSALYVKPDIDNIAVLNNVVFAFKLGKACFPASLFTAKLHKVIKLYNFRPYKSTLHI